MYGFVAAAVGIANAPIESINANKIDIIFFIKLPLSYSHYTIKVIRKSFLNFSSEKNDYKISVNEDSGKSQITLYKNRRSYSNVK
jgi:hypothetical protein